MNYRDYVQIMQAEGLQESQSVKKYLGSAVYWQNAIKNLSDQESTINKNLKKKFEELKINEILRAIEIARFEKEIGFRIEEDYEELMKYIGEGGLYKSKEVPNE